MNLLALCTNLFKTPTMMLYVNSEELLFWSEFTKNLMGTISFCIAIALGLYSLINIVKNKKKKIKDLEDFED